MADDPRRLESGKFFFDIAKFLLTAVAIGSLLTERVRVFASVVGALTRLVVFVAGLFALPPRKETDR